MKENMQNKVFSKEKVKTVYDGIRLTKKGASAAVIILSFLLFLALLAAIISGTR